MSKEEYDSELIKTHNEMLKRETECIEADARTEREKYLERRCEELETKLRKMEIENNLMKELLSRPINFTYGVR